MNKTDKKVYLQQLEQATVLFQHDTRRVYFMNNRCGLNGASPHTCTCKQNSGAMQGVWSLACGT